MYAAAGCRMYRQWDMDWKVSVCGTVCVRVGVAL